MTEPLTHAQIQVEAADVIMMAWEDSPEHESFREGAERFVLALEGSGLIVQPADLDKRCLSMSRFRRDYHNHPSTGFGVLRMVR